MDAGSIKLKGHDKKIVFPLELTHKNGDLLLQGKFTLDRNDFAIGSGQWKNSSMIASKVQIHFSIRLASDHSD
jgi:polyisoprenoid-binding protein YceI